MRIIKDIRDMQNAVNLLRKEGKSIGFVPTMGYLHKGHISLVEQSIAKTDITVASIFVNPAQFAPNEDLSRYPRDFERDCRMLDEAGVSILFYPDASEIYPEDYSTYVETGGITQKIEGEFRPTHFRGVTTVVAILFNSVKPDHAFFGQKDAQQAAVIKRMVNDLKFDIEIVVCPIVREEDGLAMSSRNIYLSAEERVKALTLRKSLLEGKKLIESGEYDGAVLIDGMNKVYEGEGIEPDYIRIVNAASFNDAEQLKNGEEYFILTAAKIGNTRLIDNELILCR